MPITKIADHYRRFQKPSFFSLPICEGIFYFREPGRTVEERRLTWMKIPKSADNIVLFCLNGTMRFGVVHAASKHLSSVEFTDPVIRAIATRTIEHLLAHACEADGGGLLFANAYSHEGSPPVWYSAMSQGMAAAALIWEYRLTGNNAHVRAAQRAIWAIRDGGQGLARPLLRGIWLDEYPFGARRVLDGALTAMACIALTRVELNRLQIHDPIVDELLSLSIEGLLSNSRRFSNILGGVRFSDQDYFMPMIYYSLALGALDYLAKIDERLLLVFDLYQLHRRSHFRRNAIATEQLLTWLVNKKLLGRRRATVA